MAFRPAPRQGVLVVHGDDDDDDDDDDYHHCGPELDISLQTTGSYTSIFGALYSDTSSPSPSFLYLSHSVYTYTHALRLFRLAT